MGLVSAIAGGLFGTITNLIAFRRGRKQTREGQALIDQANKERVDYTVPTAVTKATNRALLESQGGSALQRYMQEGTDRASASYLRAIKRGATSSTQALASTQKAVGGITQRGYNDAAIAGIQRRDQKQAIARGLQMQLGEYQDKAYDMNVQQPYLMNMQMGYDQLQAGNQNTFNALSNIGSILSSSAQMLPDDLFKKK